MTATLPEGLVRIVHTVKARKGSQEKTKKENLLALPKQRTHSVEDMAKALGMPVDQMRNMLNTLNKDPGLHGAINKRVSEINAHGRELTDVEPYEILNPAQHDALDLDDEEVEKLPLLDLVTGQVSK